MINATEAHELSMNSINMLCDAAIKDAATAGQFAAKVSLMGNDEGIRLAWVPYHSPLP